MRNQSNLSELFSDPTIKEKVLLSIIEGSLYFCKEHGEPQVQEFLSNQFIAALSICSSDSIEAWESSRCIDIDTEAFAYDIVELLKVHDERTAKTKRLYK